MKKNNWFLRIFSLVLTFVLAFTAVASSVAAAFDVNYLIDAFDYGLPYSYHTSDNYPNSSFTIKQNSYLYNIYWNIPATEVQYVELYYYLSNPVSHNIRLMSSSNSNAALLTMAGTSLGTGFYVARGTVASQLIDELTFRYVGAFPQDITILACRYSSYSTVGELGKISVYQAGTSVGSVTQSSASSPAVVTFGGSKTDIEQATWYADVTCANWRNYERLDFMFSALVLSVTSIYAFCGDVPVPVDISYIDMPSEGTAGTDPSQIDNYRKRIQFSVSVDLTDIPHNAADELILYVSGTSSLNTTGNEFRLVSTLGWQAFEPPSGIVFWLQNVWGALVDGFNNLINQLSDLFADLGDRIEAIFNGDEDQKQEMEDINSDMGDILDDMEQNATLPSISVDDYDVGQIMDDYGADTSYFGSFFAAVVNVPTIYYIFFMMLVFAFVSYIIYGSK